VIHYDGGTSAMGAISGRHTISSCGRWFQDRYKPNAKRLTDDVLRVTCKSCIKKLDMISKMDP